jgi:hypothetical protein
MMTLGARAAALMLETQRSERRSKAKLSASGCKTLAFAANWAYVAVIGAQGCRF